MCSAAVLDLLHFVCSGAGGSNEDDDDADCDASCTLASISVAALTICDISMAASCCCNEKSVHSYDVHAGTSNGCCWHAPKSCTVLLHAE